MLGTGDTVSENRRAAWNEIRCAIPALPRWMVSGRAAAVTLEAAACPLPSWRRSPSGGPAPELLT
jgi:hypothetical protein